MKVLLALTLFLTSLMSLAQPDTDEYFRRANAKYKSRDLVNAITICDKILAIDDQHYEALLLKGTAMYDRGDYEHGIEWVGKSIAAYDRNPEAYFERGLMLYYHGNVKEASEDFIKASNIGIKSADYAYFKGISLLEIGETYEGCRAIKRAKKIGIDEDIEQLEEKYDCDNVEKPETSKLSNKIKEKLKTKEKE